MRTAASLVVLALSSAGCFAVTDLDRFEPDTSAQGGNGAAPSYRDLRFTLKNMKPHAAHNFYYRIVNDQNLVVGVGTLSPFGPSTKGTTSEPLDTLLVVDKAVPRLGGLMHLDFYADVDHSGDYSGIGDIKSQDHAWRIDSLNAPDASLGRATEQSIDLTFSHNTNFNDIDAGGRPRAVGLDARITLANPGALLGRLVEVRVIDRANQHTVGLHRATALDAAHALALVPGMIDPGVDYDVEVYADRNGDGRYQDTSMASGDGGWRLSATADDDGLTVSVDLATPASPPVSVHFSYP